MSTLCRCQSVNSVPFQNYNRMLMPPIQCRAGKLDEILFYLSVEYFANLILQRIFFVVIEEKKKGRRDGKKT